MINEPNFQLFLKNTRNWLTNQIDIIPFIEANNLQNINEFQSPSSNKNYQTYCGT